MDDAFGCIECSTFRHAERVSKERKVLLKVVCDVVQAAWDAVSELLILDLDQLPARFL